MRAIVGREGRAEAMKKRSEYYGSIPRALQAGKYVGGMDGLMRLLTDVRVYCDREGLDFHTILKGSYAAFWGYDPRRGD